MSTAELKLELIRYIDSLNEAKLKQIYKLLIKQTVENKKDFWDELKEWEKKDIELGIKDLETGKFKDIDQVLAKYK